MSLSVNNMAAVVGLNGQVETFANLKHTPTNDDQQRKIFLRANQVMSSNDSCHVSKICPLADNGSIKPAADVTPDPGYVIKASASGSVMKVFINVCKKESIDKPSSEKQIQRAGRFGLSWTIPHALTEQVISGSQYNQTYRVFDFQVHPDTCRMAETNNRFKNMLNELAVGSVAEEFNVHLNARKLQFRKMKYKAVQVICRKKDQPKPQDSNGVQTQALDKMTVLNCTKEHNIKLSMNSSKSEILGEEEKANLPILIDADANNYANSNNFIVPKYTTAFSANEEVLVVNGITFSKMLVLDVELPLINSALAINLDVFEKSINLVSTGSVQYKLEVDLPCVIDENHSFAKFIKSRKILHVTMPVLTSKLHASLVESSAVSDCDEVFVSKSDINDKYISPSSVTSTDIASGHRSGHAMSTKDEHAVDQSLRCSVEVDGHVLQFFHSQDLETVSFIFTADGVMPGSVSAFLMSDTLCKLEMDERHADDGSPSHICCFLKFDEDCRCSDGGVTVDVTSVSVMLLIAKASQCCHMWNTFLIGPDTEHLEVRHMLYTCILISVHFLPARRLLVQSLLWQHVWMSDTCQYCV